MASKKINNKKNNNKKETKVKKKNSKNSSSKIYSKKNKTDTSNKNKIKSLKKSVKKENKPSKNAVKKSNSTKIVSSTKKKKITKTQKLTKSKLLSSSASSKKNIKHSSKNTSKNKKVLTPVNTKNKNKNNNSTKFISNFTSEESNQNKSNWTKKYGFDDEYKAGQETVKEIPALIIEPKENPKEEIKEDKIKDITSSVTNPKYSTSFLDAKTDKEPEGKFEMEFLVRCSPDLLFEFLYTPSGLSEWFCDDVNIRNGVYTFNWNGEISQARLLKMVEGERVRYQWVNRTDGAYFEFRIVKDELTGDVSLFITDFAEPPWDIEGGKRLWQQQIERLLKLIGSLY